MRFGLTIHGLEVLYHMLKAWVVCILMAIFLPIVLVCMIFLVLGSVLVDILNSFRKQEI